MPDEELQYELDALAVELGRSLTIDSPSGELVAYSAQSDDADQARISSILLRRVAPEIREWELRHLSDRPAGPVMIPANADLGMSARVCIPLIRDDRILGLLWMVLAEGSLSDTEERALARGADTLARLLDGPSRRSYEVVAPGREADRLVRRLFEDGQVAAYDQFAVAVPGIVEGTVRVVAVVAADSERARPFRSSEFNTLSGALTPILRPKTGYLGSHVALAYALIAVHQKGGAAEPTELLDEVDRVVRRSLGAGVHFTLGISDGTPFGLRSAREARNQALAAAELAIVDPTLDRRSYWSGLGAYRFLSGGTRSSERVLAPLDDAGSSAPMLLETLETFLDLAGDIQAVAARLTLHRSSLYYRLNRISQLLAADLSDGMMRLELHIALKHRRARRRSLK
jgi:hypothetical protein